jgi:hypothetical protein
MQPLVAECLFGDEPCNERLMFLLFDTFNMEMIIGFGAGRCLVASSTPEALHMHGLKIPIYAVYGYLFF